MEKENICKMFGGFLKHLIKKCLCFAVVCSIRHQLGFTATTFSCLTLKLNFIMWTQGALLLGHINCTPSKQGLKGL